MGRLSIVLILSAVLVGCAGIKAGSKRIRL